jgi:hypothetical protein
MSIWSENPTFTTAVVGAIAGLAGGIIPAVAKGMFDHWGQTKRLHFERQQKLIDAQSELLDELGRVCWKFRYDAIRVAYYWRSSQLKEYSEAADNYVKECWNSLSELRFIGTRAGRLFSRSALDKVEEIYNRVDVIDSKIEKAISEDAESRGALFDEVYPIVADTLRIEIAELILDLAKLVHLTPDNNWHWR